MRLITYLNFNGTCKEAFNFYAETFGGKVMYMGTLGESPMADKVPAEMKDRIMHASIQMPGGAVLMGADHPEKKTIHPTGFCVSLQVKDPTEAEHIFKTLAEGGKVQMEFQKTFWSPGFGMCTDKFEVPWMVNCADEA